MNWQKVFHITNSHACTYVKLHKSEQIYQRIVPEKKRERGREKSFWQFFPKREKGFTSFRFGFCTCGMRRGFIGK